MHHHPTPTLACPRCGLAAYRVPRSLLDRLSSLFVPQLRLRCFAKFCGWQGLVRRDAPGTEHFKPKRVYRPRHVLVSPSRASVGLLREQGHRAAEPDS